MTAHFMLLPDRAVFAVTGEDAKPFLQGLISNDIHKAGAEKAIFAALLSPQGKFLYDFFITEHEGELLFEMDKARLPECIKRLGMYKLRSKVEFTPKPELQVAAVWGDEGLGIRGQGYYSDPRLPELGQRILYKEIPAFAGMTEGNYEEHRLQLGVPDGAKDLIPDRSLLLEYGYDELHAVDYTKGCYVGQEVTARSKHRATLRKFIHRVTGDALPTFGTPVIAGEREVGVMASSSGKQGLALLKVEEARNAVLTSNGAPLTAQLPAWCATPFAENAK